MSYLNLSLTFESVLKISRTFLDVFIIWLLLYYVIRIIRNNSRTSQIFKGIILVVLIDISAKFLGLKTVAWIADIFVNWGFLAVIIVFQPEIRSLLEKIGKTSVFSRITTLSGNEKEKLVDQIVTATMLLSKDQTGALISVEQSYSLVDFVKTGTPINSVVTAELLTSIFVTSTPLHDGAVIIQGDRIACASAYFPPTNLELSSRYGARHRAAIGISEISDALTIVVSEETGGVSITESGKIIPVNKKQLRNYLLKVICGEETELSVRRKAEVSNRIVENKELIDEYSINEPSKSKSDKRFDTAVLSKLAIKKQENLNKENKDNDIKRKWFSFSKKQKEEKVIENSTVNEIEENVIDTITPTVNDVEEVEMAQFENENLETENIEIKLPKKKERPVPSYPIHSSEGIRVMGIDEEKLKELKEKEENEKKEIEVNQDERTTFDTTKIDISKIMGYDNELDDTFAMVDGFKNKKKTVAAFSDIEEITPPVNKEGGVDDGE